MAVYILVAIICVCLLAMYISIAAGEQKAIDRYIRWCLGYLVLDATHTLAAHTFFGNSPRLDYYAPYGLLYGPLLYFAYQVAIGRPLGRWRLLLHGLPFFIFLGIYCLWLFFPALFAGYLQDYRLSLYAALTLSLFSYAIWALFFKSVEIDLRNNQEARMISMMAITLAFIAIVFLVFTYSSMMSGVVRSQLKGSIVYLTMLSAALILFSYIVNKAVRGGREHKESPVPQPEMTLSHPEAPGTGRQPAGTRYQKSGIADEQLDAYEAATRKFVEQDHAYLNDKLSLESLAQLLRIPKHHLSQVFTLRIGMNFNTYINVHRVNHAIRLMHDHPEMNITDIYLNSGFTAKASFNRYFKQLEGCTPTKYRNGII